MSPPPGGSPLAEFASPLIMLPAFAAHPAMRADDTDRGIPLPWIAVGLLGTFGTLAAIMHSAGLAIDPWSAGNLPFYIVAIVAVAARTLLPGTNLRHARGIADGAEYVGIFVCIALMGAIACYPVAALTRGYSDAKLQAVDDWLGFDWLAWYRTVADSTTLQRLGTIAYRSIYLTPALLLGYYALAAKRAEAHRFILTFWLCAIITLMTFAFMPAVGPFSYLWHGPFPYMPDSELWQPDLIPQLRAHDVHIVDLGQLRGLVSAPSFHAAAATLYIAAAWRVPRLRWPLLAMNVAMLLSTPVEGTHYLADILLGILVALVTLVIMHQAVRWSGSSRAARQ